MENSPYGKNRWYEAIPATLVWTTFIVALGLTFFKPVWAIYFIIVFDLYWLFRVVYLTFYTLISYRRYRKESSRDWLTVVTSINDWKKYYHLVFLPTYKEGLDVIRPTFEALKNSKYPSDRLIIVLAGEGRDHENFQKIGQQVQNEYGRFFNRVIITEHPADLPNEIPGKGSNLNYSGKQSLKVIDELGINYDNVIVSSLDVDTIIDPQYFGYLTYLYATSPNPTRTSYQPLTLFGNNIWTAPAPVRVAMFGTIFWLLMELARHDRMWTFSSHAMSLRMLVDVGFWEKNIVSEDSRIFLQAFLHYDGDYQVTPMYMPVNMDTVTGKNYREALGNLYKQQRRWAWGVEHVPYMLNKFKEKTNISRWIKIRMILRQLEGMYTWATAPILIFILGWLPLYVARDLNFAIIHNTPFTLEWLMRLATAGILISGVLSFFFLPKAPADTKWYNWLIMAFQWALLPVTFVIFGSIPSIDAQTRLMFGKYLGFDVTEKSRKPNNK